MVRKASGAQKARAKQAKRQQRKRPKLEVVPFNAAYVDTSAFIAFLDRSDSHHALFRRLFATPPRLITTALVIAEGHGWFLRRYDGKRAMEFLAFVDVLPNLQIEPADSGAVLRVHQVLRKFQDQPLTMADAHGLAIMEDRKIEDCWSTDRHLGLGGATLVR